MTNAELIAKIREEIERLIEESDFDESANLYSLLSFLSTIEEQPKEVRNPIFDECVANVDPEVREEVRRNIELEKEYKDYVESDPVYSKLVNRNAGLSIARHFYELGCRRTAEKYDEIEYNRQREEEKPIEQERLEEELDRFIASGKSVTVDDYGTYKVSYHDFKKVARHFAEWQKKQDDRLVDIIYQQGIEKGKDEIRKTLKRKEKK